jgi:hypothetical protein
MDILTLNFVLFVCCPLVVALVVILYALFTTSDSTVSNVKVLSYSDNTSDSDDR